MKIIRIFILLLIIGGVASFFLFKGGNNAPDANTIVENSPYPEFIYAGSSAVAHIISRNSGKDIPSYLFIFIDGVYINAQSQEQVAIKTPLWLVAKLMDDKSLSAEDGYIFINSHYIGKPKTKFAKYLTYTDVVAYSNGYLIGMRLYDNHTGAKLYNDYTDVELVMPKLDNVNIEMFNGLKSIGGIKVIQSKVKYDDNQIIVVNMKLNAPLEYILNNKLDINYMPISVSVNGWYKKDQYTYTRGRYDTLYVQVLPVNKKIMREIVKDQMGMQSSGVMESYNGWDVEKWTSTLGNSYICYKELEYGTVCVITNKLEYLNDISISETK